jgi:hypothetical protein
VSHNDSDDRARLLLRARLANGIKIVVDNHYDQQVMQQMVQEGLFRYSGTMFSEGYWWTPAGERAAEEVWQQVPVKRFETRYRDHPQVRFTLNGNKEEICHVIGPDYSGPSGGSGLWVRESLGGWLVDHPNGRENVRFKSADKAIKWALQQVGKAR